MKLGFAICTLSLLIFASCDLTLSLKFSNKPTPVLQVVPASDEDYPEPIVPKDGPPLLLPQDKDNSNSDANYPYTPYLLENIICI